MEVLEEPRVTRHLLTVDQYHLMGEAGIFEPDARVELIEGEVIEMAPMGSKHYASVSRLDRLITAAVGERAIVNGQLPLRLGSKSEPEPDLVVLKPREDFYASALPTSADALLVIEVSDSTLAYDLRIKVPLYARHGAPACWVFDLRTPMLRVFSEPLDGAYSRSDRITAPGLMPVPGLAGLEVDFTGLL